MSTPRRRGPSRALRLADADAIRAGHLERLHGVIVEAIAQVAEYGGDPAIVVAHAYHAARKRVAGVDGWHCGDLVTAALTVAHEARARGAGEDREAARARYDGEVREVQEKREKLAELERRGVK